MEHQRFCKVCERELSQQNPGSICVICQDNITKSLDEKPYYDVNDLQKILGVSAAQVRRLGREGKIPGRIPGKKHDYLKSVVDDWMNLDHIFRRTSPKPV